MNDQNLKDNENALPRIVNSPVRRLTEPVICHNPHCGFQTFEPMTRCPHCQRPMLTTTNFCMLMSLLLVLGFVLLLIGGGLGVIAYRTYTGVIEGVKDKQTVFMIMAFLLVFVFSFGLAVMAAGTWAVIFGKANWRIIQVVLGFMMGLLLIAGFGRLVLYLLLD